MVNVMQVVQYIQTREENSTLVEQSITSMLISTYKMQQRRLKNPNFPNYFYIKYSNKNVNQLKYE